MKKAELIKRLTNHAANTEQTRSRIIAEYMVHYFTNLDIPHDEKYDHWSVVPYLPKLIVSAMDDLRTSKELTAVNFRALYESETGHRVPDITNLGTGSAVLENAIASVTLGAMLKEVVPVGGIENTFDAYCEAQAYVLKQTFDKFLRHVYWKGMGDMISKSSSRGMSGKFGDTKLCTFTMAGRIMFTFSRGADTGGDFSVSFVGEEDDPLCLGAGIQSVYADFSTALAMIEDVIFHWPQFPPAQEEMYKDNENVSLAY